MKDRHQDPPAGGEEETRALGASSAGDPHEQLVDYLYDELDSDERAAFERSMLADPALKREVEAHQSTRGHFARLVADPMPAGLLDEVLRAADAQAATTSGATLAEPVAARWWQRMVDGLRGLVFQPAFGMAAVFMLVAGIALYGSRDPKDLPGMGPPQDLQRLPPVAMEPAEKSEKSITTDESPKAAASELDMERAQRGFAGEGHQPEFAPGVAALAQGHAGGALDAGDALLADRFDAQPPTPAAKPTTVLSTRIASSDDDTGMGFSKTVEGQGANADAPGTSAPSPDPDKRKPPPKAAGAAPKPPAEPAARREASVAEEDERYEAKERAQQESRSRTVTDAEVARPAAAPSEVQEANAAGRKAGVDDYGKDVPAAPPMKSGTSGPAPAKPSPSAPAPPTVEKLWSTLGQQMAAGALSDAERTLAALVKAEGETQRVKAAREELARAQANAQTKPTDTKPLPEPAKAAPSP